MAARWKEEDGNLNAGSGDFLAFNSPYEVALSGGDLDCGEMDTQSCMEDHAILAIFVDSVIASEDKRGEEEESETLLFALTEMLDSVEDDAAATLSPFDSLPDTELLRHQEHRDKPAEESLPDRLKKLRPRSPNVTPTKSDWSGDHSYILPQQTHTLLSSTNESEVGPKKAERDVEIFTSASLVNLVKIMHPYCLKLHVEEEGKVWRGPNRSTSSSCDKLGKKHALLSQGEIWKYEKPTGDSDEEINVVSDDEMPEIKSKEEEELNDGRRVKSALVKGNSSRVSPSSDKKRVSFGPVQVASFDESMGEEIDLRNLTTDMPEQSEMAVSTPLISTKTPQSPAGFATEPLTPSSEVNSNKAKAKSKSLSLQQYRQLRRKRQPLVEKRGNYSTRWPSLSEPPKELTPILCLERQRQNGWAPKMAYHYPFETKSGAQTFGSKTLSSSASKLPRLQPPEAKPSSHLRHSGSKCRRTESKICSPASPPSDVTPTSAVNVPKSKKSPAKKPTLLSSDPPNPVFLPLLSNNDRQKISPSTAQSSSETKVAFLCTDSNPQSNRLAVEIRKKFSTQVRENQPSSAQSKSTTLSPNKGRNPETRADEKPQAPSLCASTTLSKSTLPCEKLQLQHGGPTLTKETKALPEIPQWPGTELMGQTRCPPPVSHTAHLLTPAHSPTAAKEKLPEFPLSVCSSEEPAQISATVQNAQRPSGIEAADLTSLLEQFEETQAQEEGSCESDVQTACEHIPDQSSTQTESPQVLSTEKPLCCQKPNPVIAPEPDGVAPPPDLHAGVVPDTTVGAEKAPRSLLKPPLEPLGFCGAPETHGAANPLRILPQLHSSEPVDIPEPLGTEVVLSSQERSPANQQLKLFPLAAQREQTARRKNPLSKAIQIIDPRPLPSKKTHINPPESPATHFSLQIHLTVSSDHDYCVPVDRSCTGATQRNKAKTSSPTDKMQVSTCDLSAASECKKQTTTCEANTTLMPVESEESVLQHLCEDHRTTPQTLSMDRILPAATGRECKGADNKGKETINPCGLSTPPPRRGRGREKRYRRRSPRSDSSADTRTTSSSPSSSSASRSPKRKKLRHGRSDSSSCSSSPSRSISRSPTRRYRLTYSRSQGGRSRSKSWSRSRSRSASPIRHHRQWRDVYSSSFRSRRRESNSLRREQETRIQKLKAIDERRVVYVGRICRSMTHNELRERFSLFGEVECVSLHFRDGGDHYGFVTFYNTEDAFAAIDNGGKIRRPDELPFDICFGGRRQFCDSDYADLDANRDTDPTSAKSRFEDLDFDSLLKQAKRGLKR